MRCIYIVSWKDCFYNFTTCTPESWSWSIFANRWWIEDLKIFGFIACNRPRIFFTGEWCRYIHGYFWAHDWIWVIKWFLTIETPLSFEQKFDFALVHVINHRSWIIKTLTRGWKPILTYPISFWCSKMLFMHLSH